MSEDMKEQYLEEEVEREVSEIQKIELDEDTLIEIKRMLELENVEARTIYLNDSIGLETVEKVVPLIHMFNREDEGIKPEERLPINIVINSPGGELYNGSTILSTIESSLTPIFTHLNGGIGMSYALILFLAGHKRFMNRHSFLMYHELRSGGGEMSTLAEMKNTVRHYDKIQDNLDAYILSRTTIPAKKLKKKRKKNLDWFIDFETAKKFSMFDEEI